MTKNTGSRVSTSSVSTMQQYSLSVNDINTLLRGGIIQVGAAQIYLDHQAQQAIQQKLGGR